MPTSSVFDYRPRARRGGGGHSPPSLSLSSPGCAPHWGSGQRLASRLPSSPPARGSALYFAGSVLHFPWGEEKSFVAYRVKTTPGHMQGPALNPWLVSSRAKLPTRRVNPPGPTLARPQGRESGCSGPPSRGGLSPVGQEHALLSGSLMSWCVFAHQAKRSWTECSRIQEGSLTSCVVGIHPWCSHRQGLCH